jgi:hypothetical protein
MELKIVTMASSLVFGMQMTFEWRWKRGVMEFRPPPGGPETRRRVVFSTSFQKSFLRS